MQTMTSGQAACLAGSSRVRRAAVSVRPQGARPALRVVAGNEYETGVFSPLVVVVRNVMGVKEFNQFRGKAISLHSQVSVSGCSFHPLPGSQGTQHAHASWLSGRTARPQTRATPRPRFLLGQRRQTGGGAASSGCESPTAHSGRHSRGQCT